MWAGYARVSRVGDRSETLISPDLQAERIRSYAAGRGIEVEMLPPELDVSGGKVERPVLSQAIRGVEEGRFAGIIVAQLDRLSRMDIADALATIRRVEKVGGQVIAVAENFDQGTPEGRMARNVLLALGEMQLDRYKGQFRAAKEQAVKRGIWPTGTVPIGYRKREDRRLEPDPRTRAKVVRAFHLRASGEPWSRIALRLGMGQTRVAKVIQNRVYLGELRLGEWVNLESHEPLVDRALFEAAQLAQPPRAPRGSSDSLLRGIVLCAECGGSMTVDSKQGYRYYRCQRHVKRLGRRCERPAIISVLKVEGYVEAICLPVMAGVRVSAKARSRALERAQETLRQAEAELAAYQQAQSVSALGASVFLAGMTPRVEAVEQARRELADARVRSDPLPLGGEVADLWEGLSITERRHVLSGLLLAVVVSKGKGPCKGRVRVFLRGDRPVELRVASTEDVE